jgi:hypothetical protein
MLHRFRTEQLSKDGISEKVFLDDSPIVCTGYTLQHSAGVVPTVTLELPVVSSSETLAEVRIGNLEEIARLMDSDTYEKFKRIWIEVHE